MNTIFGKKVGMTSLFSDKGEKVAVTVLEVLPCRVLQIKTEEKDGYNALVMGFKPCKDKLVKNPQKGLFKKVKCGPVRHVKEVQADDYSQYQVGQEVGLEVFENVKIVDVSAVSKGKGFAGTIKRYHFHRGRETHGNKNHRAPGSIGQCAQPSKVWKGQKLPGRLGNRRSTIKNLEVMSVLKEKSLIVVRGSVPGPRNHLVDITRINGGK